MFIAGLMVGRTPEYLGKKIEAKEMKLAVLAILVLPLAILGFTAISAMLPAALSSLANAGPHGLSEILYAFSSAAGNNGSAFAGLNANTPWYNTTLGIAMVAWPLRLYRAGHGDRRVARRQEEGPARRRAASRPMARCSSALLIGVILILGGLQYFPALALGPIVEHFLCSPARPSNGVLSMSKKHANPSLFDSKITRRSDQTSVRQTHRRGSWLAIR